MTVQSNEAWSRVVEALRPPKVEPLSAWLEANLRLPSGLAAEGGPIRLWPTQKDIADALADPAIERVTLVKSARSGFTTLLTGLITHRMFEGGSLKIVASKAPRNLRRHTARILLVDEADACETGAEGNPIALAEQRTLSFPNRKLIIGSTPLDEDTSHVLRLYVQSDQRIFDVPCPECGAFTEIRWQHIEWESTSRDKTQIGFRCPHCEALIGEEHKREMVEAGAWRITKPEVANHAGFRLNALVSLLPNASWDRLVAKFLAVKDDADDLKVFVTTTLAEGWREQGEETNENELAARAEPISLDAIPPEVLCLTVGVDLGVDRLEVQTVGWTKLGDALIPA